jgi:hypothetical protein
MPLHCQHVRTLRPNANNVFGLFLQGGVTTGVLDLKDHCLVIV